MQNHRYVTLEAVQSPLENVGTLQKPMQMTTKAVDISSHDFLSSVGKGLYGRIVRRKRERYTGVVLSATNHFQVGTFMLLGLIDNVMK